MKTRRGRVFRGGHLPARWRRRSRSPCLRCRHADPTPPDAFPCCARRVARDGSRQDACLSGGHGTRSLAKCAWTRHGVAFPAGGSALRLAERWSAKAKRYENAPAARFPRRASPGEVSPTVEESVSSRSPRGSHASRCVSLLRRASRRSRWFASANRCRRLAAHVRVCALGKHRRPGAPVKQTMKAARGRQGTKRGADHFREGQAWPERHGIEQQTSATRFAAPSFLVCVAGAHGRRRRSAPMVRGSAARHRKKRWLCVVASLQ
jgi:hypothetical protein